MNLLNLGRLFFKIDHMLLSWAADRSDKRFSMTAFFALDYLAAHGESSMKTLAEALDITPASLTALSTKLEQAGRIERLPNPQDRRSSLLAITAEGGDALAEDYRTMQDFFNHYLAQDQQQQLSAIFHNIINKEHRA